MTEHQLKLLLVEDNTPASVAQTKLLLSSLNCKLRYAATGKVALEHLQKEKYDLVFMDVGLPDISGKEVTQQVRQDSGHINKSTPIIGVTATRERSEKQSCIDSGMSLVLSKPLTLDAIQAILNQFELLI